MNITYNFKDQLVYLNSKETKGQNVTKENNTAVIYLIRNIFYHSNLMILARTKMKVLVIKQLME